MPFLPEHTAIVFEEAVVSWVRSRYANKPMSAKVLADLVEFKLPAMLQSGLKVNAPEIVLASKSGLSDGLVDDAARNANVTLVDARQLLSDLTSR